RGHDATAVESDGGTERASRGDQDRAPPAEAEANDPDPPIVEAGLPEMTDRRVDVGDDALVAQAAEERHHLREVAVGRRPTPGAVEHRRSHGVMAGGGEAAR